MRARYQQASRVVGTLLIAGAGWAGSGNLAAQTKSSAVPDAQVESNVLKALATNSKLANQQISTAAVYGVVTLSGQVKDESTRSLAEDIVSRTPGVQKVVDEMTIGTQSAAAQSAPAPDQGSNPQLQSDGTMAPPAEAQNAAESGGQPPLSGQAQGNESQQQGAYDGQPAQSGASSQGAGQYGQAGPPPADPSYGANQPPYGQQGQPPYGQGQPPYAQQGQTSPYPQSGQPQYGQPGQAPYGQPGQPQYGQSGQPPYGQPGQPPYGPPQYPYGQAPGQARPYAAGDTAAYPGQAGGQVVSIPSGVTLQLRLDQGVDSRHSQIGSPFSGTVIRDVVANGFIAIPRGATVQGTVVDANRGGAIKGHASLALQLNQVTLGGRVYPVTSNVWEQDGLDKTGRTVGSAIGLGAVGAIIGGVAGGGAGAAIGAGAGGAAGIGASAASGNPQVFLPPEAVIAFQLTQPVTVTTVSQAEMERMGYGIPTGNPQMRRRYPPPPPYYYGPGYYYAPRAYYRPYPY